MRHGQYRGGIERMLNHRVGHIYQVIRSAVDFLEWRTHYSSVNGRNKMSAPRWRRSDWPNRPCRMLALSHKSARHMVVDALVSGSSAALYSRRRHITRRPGIHLYSISKTVTIDLISRHVTKAACVQTPTILPTARARGLAPIKLATLSTIASLAPQSIFSEDLLGRRQFSGNSTWPHRSYSAKWTARAGSERLRPERAGCRRNS